MPPRKKTCALTKQTPIPIEESPVVFFLKVQEDTEDDITPAGHTMGYSDISKQPLVTQYTDILKSMETTSVMSTELLKSILDKTVCDSYPQDTACFWCAHSFDWTPAVLPISYDAYKNVYTCEGNFCSPECALANLYNNIHISDTVRWNRHTMLRHMYAQMYEKKDLSPAPPRTILRMFGGPLDIAQYRGYVSAVNDIVLSDLPPIRLVFPTMNIQGPVRDIKRYVSLSSETVEKASQQLRLKRSKPVHANVPTLDMCLKAH
jgi:hypothetical protein